MHYFCLNIAANSAKCPITAQYSIYKAALWIIVFEGFLDPSRELYYNERGNSVVFTTKNKNFELRYYEKIYFGFKKYKSVCRSF